MKKVDRRSLLVRHRGRGELGALHRRRAERAPDALQASRSQLTPRQPQSRGIGARCSWQSRPVIRCTRHGLPLRFLHQRAINTVPIENRHWKTKVASVEALAETRLNRARMTKADSCRSHLLLADAKGYGGGGQLQALGLAMSWSRALDS